MTAKEYWKERFGEDPQSDADKLAVAMMQEYAQSLTKWIPVSERLPDLHGRVLVTEWTDGLTEPSVLMASRERDRWRIYGGATAENITHWMPLPPKP